MYQVIACPRCRRAKVVEAGKQTTSCPACDRPLELAHLRAHFTGPDVESARHAAGILNARLSGREEEYLSALVPPAPRAARHEDPFDAAAASARHASSEKDRADRVARALSDALREFDEASLARALAKAGIPTARVEAHVLRMLATSVLFEPRAGVYRAFAG